MRHCLLRKNDPVSTDMKKPNDPKEPIRFGIVPAAYGMLGWIMVVVISSVLLLVFRWFV